MRYVQYAAIILFCLWTLAMIGHSIIKLRSLGRDRERFARVIQRFGPGERADEASEEHETELSWVEHPGATSWVIVSLGALWFFPAFFFLCVFLFAGE